MKVTTEKNSIVVNKLDVSERDKIHAKRVLKIQNDIVTKVASVRNEAKKWRDDTLQKRSENIKKIRQNLADTTHLIQKQHDHIKTQINEDTVHREVNIRVNRGLEALEKFIQILRQTSSWEGVMERAIYDPIVSRSIKSEAYKTLSSDFFKAVYRQTIMQTEFINIAAHELRTPIMPIIMNAELLRSELGENEEINIILRNAKRLKRLTENILNVTRIESNSLKLNHEKFELNEIINDIIEEEKPQSGAKINFDFKPKNKIFVTADKDRITQVIFNLLNNAIKFTKDKIVITTEKDENNVTVTVMDDGKGIDPNVFPVLFSKFVTKSYKGTGLGLYISKVIVDSHGGKIYAENNYRTGLSGAKFTFKIPIKGQVKTI